jgi:SAM-dependent methyltransferase
MTCPLCNSLTRFLSSGEQREYWLCSECYAISVPTDFHLRRKEEVKRYLEHENSLENEGYVQMFQKKISILQEHFPEFKTALDYGCGYEPVLKSLLEKIGIEADGYDPNFFPETDLKKSYDLVISTETFEHFRNPAKEVSIIADRVTPGGILAIMTRFYPTDENVFSNWYYKRDPTHIFFYGTKTFQWLAKNIGFKMVFNNEHDFVVLRRSV